MCQGVRESPGRGVGGDSRVGAGRAEDKSWRAGKMHRAEDLGKSMLGTLDESS